MVIQKSEIFLKEKTVKLTNGAHAFKDYNDYNVEILNSHNLDLQLKDNESIIKNKLTNYRLITEKLQTNLRLFKFRGRGGEFRKRC